MAGTNPLRVAAVAAALVLASALALLAGGALAPFHPANAQTPPEDFVPGEVLVKFEPGATGQEIAAAHRQNDAEVEEVIPGIGVRVVDVPVGRERSALAAYERNPNVSFAEVNGVVRLADHGAPNDKRVHKQWQYNNTGQTGGRLDADIDAFEAWHVTRGSVAVDIAIVDSGIDLSHPDLLGKIIKNHNVTGSDTLDDRIGHGTHVAVSAAAVTDNLTGVAGTCPDCSLYNVKIVGDKGGSDVARLAKGIRWAADNGAEVINMSLGTSSKKATLKSAVDYAWGKGVVLVAAAGNYRTNDKFYPAAYPNVIAVAATDHNDRKAKFSNYGKKWVDIGAPGVHILSTVPGGGYESWKGTSMATPHVAGVAGLVWSTGLCDDGNPETNDNACVSDRIKTRADPILRLRDYWTNGRRLNALNSVSP
jgi:thermitase